MLPIHKISRTINRWIEYLLFGLGFSMALVVALQVFFRYVLNHSLFWSEELARFLLIWIGVLGAAYAFRTGVHLGLDVLPKKLTGTSAQALKLFTLATVIVFAVAVLVIGFIGFLLDRGMLMLQRRFSWDKTAILR